MYFPGYEINVVIYGNERSVLVLVYKVALQIVLRYINLIKYMKMLIHTSEGKGEDLEG